MSARALVLGTRLLICLSEQRRPSRWWAEHGKSFSLSRLKAAERQGSAARRSALRRRSTCLLRMTRAARGMCAALDCGNGAGLEPMQEDSGTTVSKQQPAGTW